MAAIDVLDLRTRSFVWDVLGCMSAATEESRESREALRGAAIALGVAGPAPVHELDQLSDPPLSPRDRVLVYATAAWMTLADGIREHRESEVLAELRERLGVSEADARFFERHARWVRTSTGDLPPHREVDLLLTEGARRLAAVEARRAA